MNGIGVYNEPGGLIWEDARLTDPEAGKRFYAEVFGYTYQPVPGAPDDYGTFHLGGDPLGGMGGMMGLPEGTPSHWVAYFAVADTDAAVAAVEQAGGTVLMPRLRHAIRPDGGGGRSVRSIFMVHAGGVDGIATSRGARRGGSCHPLRTPRRSPMSIRETSWPTGTPCWVDLAVPDVADRDDVLPRGAGLVVRGHRARSSATTRSAGRSAGPRRRSARLARARPALGLDGLPGQRRRRRHRQADRGERRDAAGRADRHRRQRPDVRRASTRRAACSGSGRPSRRSAWRSPTSPGRWSGPTPGCTDPVAGKRVLRRGVRLQLPAGARGARRLRHVPGRRPGGRRHGRDAGRRRARRRTGWPTSRSTTWTPRRRTRWPSAARCSGPRRTRRSAAPPCSPTRSAPPSGCTARSAAQRRPGPGRRRCRPARTPVSGPVAAGHRAGEPAMRARAAGSARSARRGRRAGSRTSRTAARRWSRPATTPRPGREPCQVPAGTTSCGRWPAARSGPSTGSATGPSGRSSSSAQRRSGVPVVDLGGGQRVQRGELRGEQQVVDGRGVRVQVGAAEQPALVRQRLQPEPRGQLLTLLARPGHHAGHRAHAAVHHQVVPGDPAAIGEARNTQASPISAARPSRPSGAARCQRRHARRATASASPGRSISPGETRVHPDPGRAVLQRRRPGQHDHPGLGRRRSARARGPGGVPSTEAISVIDPPRLAQRRGRGLHGVERAGQVGLDHLAASRLRSSRAARRPAAPRRSRPPRPAGRTGAPASRHQRRRTRRDR